MLLFGRKVRLPCIKLVIRLDEDYASFNVEVEPDALRFARWVYVVRSVGGGAVVIVLDAGAAAGSSFQHGFGGDGRVFCGSRTDGWIAGAGAECDAEEFGTAFVEFAGIGAAEVAYLGKPVWADYWCGFL